MTLISGAMVLTGSTAIAQQRTIHVMGDDGQGVGYANVTLAGERPRITNEAGDIDIGTSARGSLMVDVRRMGYEPWYGAVTLNDTTTMVTVTLHRISRRLFTVKVVDTLRTVPILLRGFYERMLARQRGIGTGIYLTPEEIERHSTNLATSLLQGINGVQLQHTSSGKIVAMNANGSCQMAVLIDGHRVCPENGCDVGAPPPPSAAAAASPPGASRRSRNAAARDQSTDGQFVIIDNLVSETDVVAIEVYARGATIPPSLLAVDASCGLVAFWTGGRKTP
ncbi:MAG TPA: hypothetical protein VGQ30_08600 [Gemmatimonadaceae bacterium]|jgi:hypothetical protein|nr:hypothetical protein [Gemmatimonadaceae bacterium]